MRNNFTELNKENTKMTNFTNLNAKEMNETDGGFIPFIVAGIVVATTAIYTAYQASKN